MPVYSYKAKKGPTEIVEGQVNAENEDAALAKISTMGLIPVKLTAGASASPAGSKSATGSAGKKSRSRPAPASTGSINKIKIQIPYRDLNVFIRQFSILLKANVPLLRAFEVLQNQTQNLKFRRVLQDVANQIREGSSLSETLAQYPRIFSKIFVSLIHAGEVSGTLDKVLIRLADFAEREAEVRSKVRSALVYPLFLAFVGVGTIFVLLAFVMPRLTVVFEDLGTELPEITQVMLKISGFCQNNWLLILAAAGALMAWSRTIGYSEVQMNILDRITIRLPVLGRLIEKADVSKFLRALELLYENGIPLYQAVEISAHTVSNRVIRAELIKVPARLEGGATFADSMASIPYVSDFVTNMISVGEESGQLGSAVGETAAFFEQETNQFIKLATSLLEPMMILGIGLLVGFIVVSMLLPIFEIHVMAG